MNSEIKSRAQASTASYRKERVADTALSRTDGTIQMKLGPNNPATPVSELNVHAGADSIEYCHWVRLSNTAGECCEG